MDKASENAFCIKAILRWQTKNPFCESFQRLIQPRRVLCSGTATVALLLRMMGWSVTANDFLAFNNVTARLLLSANHKPLSPETITSDLKTLLEDAPIGEELLVATHFEGIFFTTEENTQIDRFCQNISAYSPYERDLYTYSVGQALLMKRPYNLFHRANLSMRTRSVERSFGNLKTWNTSILQHATKIARSVVSMSRLQELPEGVVTQQNTLDLSQLPDSIDLVYLDPPYLNSVGQGVDYCSFYHFLEGLCDYQSFKDFNPAYPHRPIVAKPSAWLTKEGSLDELRRVLRKWPKSTIVLSYRSDGQPDYTDISLLFRNEGRRFQAVDAHKYKYALSHKVDTKELLLISTP